MENKERFIEIFNDSIHRDGSDKLMEWLEKSDFFYAPASTRFHGNYEGGLLEHSLNVYDCLRLRIMDDGQLYDDSNNCKISKETLAIVSLLHDICKVNFYKKGFRNVKQDGQWISKEVYEVDEKFPCGYHADKSIIILQQFIKLEPDEILAIRAHMGGWDTAVQGGSKMINSIFEKSRLAVHLHLADAEVSYLWETRSDE